MLIRTRNNNSFTLKYRPTSSHNLDKLKDDLRLALNKFELYDLLPIAVQFEVFQNILLELYNKWCPVKWCLTNRITKP